jgi:hypothetical protein
MSLSVNKGRRLEYPAARSPREEDIMSLPHLVGHRSMAFGSAWVEAMGIRKASVWRVQALKEHE